MIDILGEQFRDQVMGCWMGKNCGGTLGTPLEKGFGEEEPFNISWYPKLEPGGMPNDDLEMQLVWLKALEEQGINLTARELAGYWLDHIGYIWDEYGRSKTNLRLGLRPPVSGAYNNWFVDCMGCPIRSEIWACIAPGEPRVAVRYAYQDAICDHAGGESVWGEFFNTAIESAAFIEHDINKLFDIGRSYVPDHSLTARAIDAARKAHAKGLSWQEARKAVMAATPHYVAQYSPINMGFQVIGLLYGKDFGDTLCLTVNCGYDTDCTGATVGSILGIISGNSKLPKKWTEPLGYALSTNASWGGLKNVLNGSNPIPSDLHELTDRTIAIARLVMAGVDVSKDTLMADDKVFDLCKEPPMSIHLPSPELDVRVLYGDDPVVVPGQKRVIVAELSNPHAEVLRVSCRLHAPKGWTVAPSEAEVAVAPGKQELITWTVSAKAKDIANSNTLSLIATIDRRPAPPAVPVVLVGARVCQVSGPYGTELEAEYAPEKFRGTPYGLHSRGGNWKTGYAHNNALPAKFFAKPGATYVRQFIRMQTKMDCVVGTHADCPTRTWVNGKLLSDQPSPGPLRPHMGEPCPLRKGWNEILIKVLAPRDNKPEVHILLYRDNAIASLREGLAEGEWTKLPEK